MRVAVQISITSVSPGQVNPWIYIAPYIIRLLSPEVGVVVGFCFSYAANCQAWICLGFQNFGWP